MEDLYHELKNFTNTADATGIPFLLYNQNKIKIKVPYPKIPELLGKYCQYVSNNIEDTNDFSIAEYVDSKKHPLIVNFQFRFENDNEDDDEPNFFNDNLIQTICYCIQSAQMELLQISPNYQECVCIVQETAPWMKNKEWCINVKFQFPYCVINQSFYTRSLKPNIIRKLRNENIMKYMEKSPIGDLNDMIFDIGEYLPLYGSIGLDQSPYYTLAHIYPIITKDNLEQNNIIELDLSTSFQVVNHTWIHNGFISADFLAINVNIDHWLPLFLSCHFYPGVTHIKEVEEDKTITNNNNKEFNDPNIASKDPKIILKFLLPLLNIHRVTTVPFWLDVGRAIYTIYNGNEEGFKKWVEFSNRGDIDERTCLIKWSSFRADNYISIRTIAQYAKKDNPEVYMRWHEMWYHSVLCEAASGRIPVDVAEVVYRFFWLDFICVQSSKNGWYYFNGINLVIQDDGIKLRQGITNEFTQMCKEKRHRCSQNSKDTSLTEKERGTNEGYVAAFSSLIKALGMGSFKNQIIKFCQEKFYDDNFKKAKNFDHAKMGWGNCITEVCDSKIYKREGKIEDYITKNTNTPILNLSWEHPLVKEVLDWYGKLFVDPELLHFFKKILASFFWGKNAEKLFQVWTGGTNAGKSIIIKFIKKILGIYAVDIPEEIFICKPTSRSGPSPELAQMDGAHAGFISETGTDSPFTMNSVKKWTGGDSFFGRMCGDDGGSINALLKMILMCNEPPNIRNADDAVHNRWLHLPFLSVFVNNPPESIEEQYRQRKFKNNPYFENKIPDLSLAGAWIMFESFNDYITEGITNPPKIIVDHTEQYWKEHDPISNFISEKIEFVYTADGQKDTKYSLSATEIHPHYTKWFKQYYSHPEQPCSCPQLKSCLSTTNNLGAPVGHRWYGVILRKTEPQQVPPTLK